MTASNPITIEGIEYPKYSLNLAITGKYNADGSTDANVAMRLVPTAIQDGQVITADAAAKSIALGTLSGADAATQQAVAAIQSTLQTYLQSKGL